MIDTVLGVVMSKGPGVVSLQLPVGFGVTVLVPNEDDESFAVGREVRVYTQLLISGAQSGDGELKLYGFLTDSDRQMFTLLKSVSGVGGKAALLVLGKGLLNVVDAIVRNEPDMLKTKGIGPKTSKRIVSDLSKKIKDTFGSLCV